jgi:hypothetical protein
MMRTLFKAALIAATIPIDAVLVAVLLALVLRGAPA